MEEPLSSFDFTRTKLLIIFRQSCGEDRRLLEIEPTSIEFLNFVLSSQI